MKTRRARRRFQPEAALTVGDRTTRGHTRGVDERHHRTGEWHRRRSVANDAAYLLRTRRAERGE
jgi:hypothetical protein